MIQCSGRPLCWPGRKNHTPQTYVFPKNHLILLFLFEIFEYMRRSNDLRAIADVAAPNADVFTSSADIVASNDECFMMFQNVLRVLHDVSLGGSRCFTMYHNVLHLFHDVFLCLTMFYDVYQVTQRSASPHWRPPIASRIAITPQGSAITPQKSAMAPQGSSISPRT